MTQLPLFANDDRPVVLVLDRDDGDAAFLRRRLRRSARLQSFVIGPDQLRAGDHGLPTGAPEPVAVVLRLREHPTAVPAVRELVRGLGGLPVVVVVAGRSEFSLAVLEAGAAEVVGAEEATATALERAVLSAVSRRVADRRSQASMTDPLTGLDTRAQLHREVPARLARSGRDGIGVAALFCDLDRFKPVNDTLGHAVGDRLLVEVGRRLRGAVRTSDLVIRLGGDEFVLVIEGRDVREVADEVARRVVRAIAAPFHLGEHTVTVSVSVGLAVHEPGEDALSLVARADRALYLAKRRGRSGIAHHDDELQRSAARTETAGELLREGIRRDLLEVEVRPVMAGDGSRLVGHLYVPTWGSAAHSTGRAAPTRRPVAVARDAALAPALFRWTLRRVAGDAERGSLSPTPTRRYVEAPPALLTSSPARSVEPALARPGVDASTIVVVVDESALGDSAAVRSGLLELSRAGVRVAVGRFGAELASLCLLERHPFDAVWMDRQMVDGLAACPVRRAKVAAAVGVAGALGIQVLADAPSRPTDAAALAEHPQVALVERAVDLGRLVAPTGGVAPARGVSPGARGTVGGRPHATEETALAAVHRGPRPVPQDGP